MNRWDGTSIAITEVALLNIDMNYSGLLAFSVILVRWLAFSTKSLNNHQQSFLLIGQHSLFEQRMWAVNMKHLTNRALASSLRWYDVCYIYQIKNHSKETRVSPSPKLLCLIRIIQPPPALSVILVAGALYWNLIGLAVSDSYSKPVAQIGP